MEGKKSKSLGSKYVKTNGTYASSSDHTERRMYKKGNNYYIKKFDKVKRKYKYVRI